MRNTSLVLVAGAATAAAVGLLTAAGWPGYVIGAVLAVALWVMLWAGSKANRKAGNVPAAPYGLAAVLSVAVGYLLFRLTSENSAMWAPGFIGAGLSVAMLYPYGRSRARDEQ